MLKKRKKETTEETEKDTAKHAQSLTRANIPSQ